MDIELLLKLLRYTRHLRGAASSVSFDYSAIQTLASRISDAVKGSSPRLVHLRRHTQALEDAISLSTGLGLSNLWTKLLANAPMKAPELRDLDAMACNLTEFDERTSRSQHCPFRSCQRISLQNSDSRLFTSWH